MKRKELVLKTRREAVTVTRSDFSGRVIPDTLHWGTITKIWCNEQTHPNQETGNVFKVFALDLLPEEMSDFRAELEKLVQSFYDRHISQRNANIPDQKDDEE